MSTSLTQHDTRTDGLKWYKHFVKEEHEQILDKYEDIVIKRAAVLLSKEQPQRFSEITEEFDEHEGYEEKVKGYEEKVKKIEKWTNFRTPQIAEAIHRMLEKVRKKAAVVHETAIIKAKDAALYEASILESQEKMRKSAKRAKGWW